MYERGCVDLRQRQCDKEVAVPPREADGYVEKRSIIIDLREKEGYESGHLRGAVSVAMEIPISEEDIQKLIWVIYREKARHQKECKVLLYCHRGGASLLIANELRRRGICVFTLVGGMEAYRGKYLVKSEN